MPRPLPAPFPVALASRLTELWFAAPQVIALRGLRMMTPARTEQARRSLGNELFLMNSEKILAAHESLWAVALETAHLQMQWTLRWLAAWVALPARIVHMPAAVTLPRAPGHLATAHRLAQRGLAPVHKRATANVRRLRRALRSS